MTVEAQITINANKAAVWAVIANIEGAADIISGIDKIEVVERPTTGILGWKWRETRILFGKPATVEKVIIAGQENDFFTTESKEGGFLFSTYNRIWEKEGAIVLRSIHETKPQGFVASLKALPMVFFKGMIKKAILQDLTDIKFSVEGTRPLNRTMPDARFTAYLFEHHSSEIVRGWARALRHIRFCRAFGGHNNDGDSFRCSLPFHDENGLLSIAERMSLAFAPLLLDTPRPVPGKSYSWGEYQQFRHPIDAFPHYEQPGLTKIFGIPAFVWVGRDSMDIQLSGADGDSYTVTDSDFQNAKCLEVELARLGLEFRDPPLNSQHCICPAYWPEFFKYDAA